jgi:MFS family permease
VTESRDGQSATAPGRSAADAVESAARERARVAVAVVFVLSGIAFASWLSRLPAVRDALELSPSQVGALLLCLTASSVVALPAAGPLVRRFGPGRVVASGAVIVAGSLVLIGLGTTLGAFLVTGFALVLTGAGIAVWDVAMNVEGADVERRLGRTLMPRFHAAFSVGAVCGALLGAASAAGGVSVLVQLVATAVVVVLAVAVAVRAFLPLPPRPEPGRTRGPGLRRAWLEPRTLRIGLFVLAFALTEGVANDWLTLAFTDGHDTSDAVGALGLGAFVAAMTLARTFGGTALERWGRVAVLRAAALIGLGGLLMVVFATWLPLVVVGTLLWGCGAALGFPVGMTAAADDPDAAAVRVSVVSCIGYSGFLAGPPLIGFLAEQAGILRALLIVAVALGVGCLTAGATRSEVPRPAPGSAPTPPPR